MTRQIVRRISVLGLLILPLAVAPALAGSGDSGTVKASLSPGPASASDTAGEAVELDGWRAPEEVRAVANPLESTDEIIAAAAKMYGPACSRCHGTAGKGDGRTARFLDVTPADFTQRVPLQSDGELYWKVTAGKKPMPGFEEDLTDEQRWGLVLYLRTLAPAAAEDSVDTDLSDVEEAGSK